MNSRDAQMRYHSCFPFRCNPVQCPNVLEIPTLQYSQWHWELHECWTQSSMILWKIEMGHLKSLMASRMACLQSASSFNPLKFFAAQNRMPLSKLNCNCSTKSVRILRERISCSSVHHNVSTKLWRESHHSEDIYHAHHLRASVKSGFGMIRNTTTQDDKTLPPTVANVVHG